jgi:hypothetical protein
VDRNRTLRGETRGTRLRTLIAQCPMLKKPAKAHVSRRGPATTFELRATSNGERFGPGREGNSRPICLKNCCAPRNIFGFSTSLPVRRR